jgi:histidinol phosphatase-like PHP family hydrolase
MDIYVNPTFLPDVMASGYDRFWTAERMQKVIDAAVKHDVAIEINNRYRIPSAKFIRAAKAAGAKFSFGTNNTDRNLGRLEYPLDMVRECGLTWSDIFVPKPDGEKPVQKRGLPPDITG